MSLTPQSWHPAPNVRNRDTHSPHVERRVEDLLNALETTLTASSYTVDHPPTSLSMYGRALKRHKFALIFFALFCAAVGFLISQRETKVYQARTTIELL